MSVDDAQARVRRVTNFLAGEEWRVIEFREVGRDTHLSKYRTYGPLQELARRPGLVHFVGLSIRPGVNLFARTLELTYFPPLTARNDDYELRCVQWEDMGWVLVSIPARNRRWAERTAEKLHLRIADGVPAVATSDRPEPRRFPLCGPNVHQLEFSESFPVGQLQHPGGIERLHELEQFTIDALERKYFSETNRN